MKLMHSKTFYNFSSKHLHIFIDIFEVELEEYVILCTITIMFSEVLDMINFTYSVSL